MSDKIKDGRRFAFFMLDNDMIDYYAERIGVYGLAIYSLLVRYADANGENSFPSYSTISKKLGISRPMIKPTLDLLIKNGLITKENRETAQGDRASNLYTIVQLEPGKPRLLEPDQTPAGSKPHLLPSKPDLLPLVNDVNYPSKPDLLYQYTTIKTPIDQDTGLQTDQPETVSARASSRGSVGLSEPEPGPAPIVSRETKPPPGGVPASAPPIRATDPPRSFPAPAEVERSVKLLTDPAVGLSRAKAYTHGRNVPFIALMAHVGAWWVDYQAHLVDGAGALHNRIADDWEIKELTPAFLRSELYARHYPITDGAQLDDWRDYWGETGGGGEYSDYDPPLWLAGLSRDVIVSLEQLPPPPVVYDYSDAVIS